MRFFWIDAFADRPFSGNPAVVCIAPRELPCETQQSLASEFNVSETVFLAPAADAYSIRWFTPTVEVPLVGHATLAAASALLGHLERQRARVSFVSPQSGRLEAWREAEGYAIDLPADEAAPCEPPSDLIAGLGAKPQTAYRGRHYMAVFRDEQEIAGIAPDFGVLARLDLPTVVATAPGRDCDYVLRFFAPRNGVPEDPVSGVAQCSLVPYWSRRLGRERLMSRQLSARGGGMTCWLNGDRVAICGPCRTIAEGAFDSSFDAEGDSP